MHRRTLAALVLTPALTLAGSVAGAGTASAQPLAADGSAACPWVGSTAPAAERAAMVVRAMTLDEKLRQVHGTAGLLQAYGPVYAGQVAANPRLCIPALGLSDGPAGVGNSATGVTQLPAPIALGATWDRDLARRYGQVMGAEVRGKGAQMSLGPSLDVARDPRAGRHFESFGEDPDLIGEIARKTSEGIQSQGVLSTAKHLAAYTQETGRNTANGNAVVDQRTLHELYLAPYEKLVDSGVDGVMCSYNKVNGVHACNDGYLMNQVLKGSMGFRGFTVSDWFGMHSAVASANAGLDLQMPDSCYFDSRLRAGLKDGLVATNRLDDMVTRVLTPMFERGLFDRPAEGSQTARVTTTEHAAVARQVADAGTVLLRNTGVLPLNPATTKSVAVIGSAAGRNTLASGGGSAHVIADDVVTPLEGIAARARQAGVTTTSYTGALPGAAADAAKKADVAVVVVSVPMGESKDQGDLQLSLVDRGIVKAVAEANPRTVVVLNSGGPVEIPSLDRLGGLLAVWYPGQEYGSSLAGILFGDTNPSGRLPVTFPARLADVPAAARDRFPGGQHDEGLAVGYRWYDQQGITPGFAFGSGLSYTTFAYSGLTVGAEDAQGTVPVTVTVRNTGTRAGTVTPQVYAEAQQADRAVPRTLVDFARVALEPGESKTVTMAVTARDLAHWDKASTTFARRAGTYRLWVGDSSRELPLEGSATVSERTGLTRPVPGPAQNQPAGNETAGESVKDAFVCGAGGFMAGGVGLASYFGLAPQQQSVAPVDDTLPSLR